MGMLVYVYRNSQRDMDCTNGGVTSKYHTLCVTNVDGPFGPDDDIPAVKLMPGNLPGTVKIVPEEEIEKGSWTMFGGNYASTSDSRFSEKIEKMIGSRFYGAVPVHDRVE